MSYAHKTQVFAHRGANREAAENTQTAFDAALNYAIDGIETDVQLSRDDVTVLWHDETLEKIGISNKHIDDFDFAQLQEMNVATHFFANASPESFLPLQNFLDRYRERCRLLLEIKCYEGELPERQKIKVQQTLAMVGAVTVTGSEIMISSFHLPSLIYAHECSLNSSIVYNLEPEQNLADAKEALAAHSFLQGLCVHISTLDAAMVQLLRSHHKHIAVYTCNSDEEINTALKLGVDILITDFPQKALQLRDQ
jgi:glycerophosphoryl diester phosphodiesterase